MATPLSKPVSRETVRDFAHYKRKIVVTLAPGTDQRDDLIQTRLKGQRERYVARLADIHRVMAQWHGLKLAKAKKEARKAGVPWQLAKKTFDRQNRID